MIKGISLILSAILVGIQAFEAHEAGKPWRHLAMTAFPIAIILWTAAGIFMG